MPSKQIHDALDDIRGVVLDLRGYAKAFGVLGLDNLEQKLFEATETLILAGKIISDEHVNQLQESLATAKENTALLLTATLEGKIGL